jgi:hypothetical protein
MNKEQICKICGEKMKLTEITTDTGHKIFAYMCGCNEMTLVAKEKFIVRSKLSKPTKFEAGNKNVSQEMLRHSVPEM